MPSRKALQISTNASIVDLFCGAGGLTHGFKLEGFSVAAGIDSDEGCRYAYEYNNEAPFIRRDVAKLRAADLRELFFEGQRQVLIGCAPCQPFSTYNQSNADPKWRLVEIFAKLILDTQPDIVSMENVPQLVNFQNGRIFQRFKRRLERNGYSVDARVVFAPEYGVPQRRSRLVLLASRLGEIRMEEPTVIDGKFGTVNDTIGNLPELRAGGVDPIDPLHRASRLSDRNLKRIRASRPGGSWRDWESSLVAGCHKVASGSGYGAVYGRMEATVPSPTITTQFFGFGNGRFGHPAQDRGLSLREGALLQTFPSDYSFVPPGRAPQFKQLGRMIGNAVPVTLARAIARSVKGHLERYAT